LQHIDGYRLGPSRKSDDYSSDDDLKISKRINDMLDDLEDVVKEVHSVAQNISQTGKSLVGNEWEGRSYGRVYEVYNGTVFIDLSHSEDDIDTWLEGKVVLTGDDGFSGGDSDLARNLGLYFRDCGIKFTEEEFFPAAAESAENY
jgi:hypothetical protein